MVLFDIMRFLNNIKKCYNLYNMLRVVNNLLRV